MQQPTKTIFHLDLDCFYVSAERLRDASLKGRPVAVGGSGPRAVISSCSYEARKWGVRSAMPVTRALKQCPKLVLIPVDMDYYSALSKKVFGLLENFTPIHETVSIDEAYLDMTGTGSLLGPSIEAAKKLRAAILKETSLTASVGVASNRLVAKVATDRCKPDNILVVPPGEEARFLAPLGAEKLPGCGKVTQSWLASRDIKTIAKLQTYPLESLLRQFGEFGRYLHDAAWGRGSTAFNEEPKTRSISREITFDDDTNDSARLQNILWQMAAEMGRTLRHDGDHARALRLKLRYPPFDTVVRSRVLKRATQLDKDLHDGALELFEDHWTGTPLRLIGLGAVLGEKDPQLGLFEAQEKSDGKQRLDELKDKLNRRFGEKALRTGRDLESI